MATNQTTKPPGRTEETNGRTGRPQAVGRVPHQSTRSVLDDFCSWLITATGAVLVTLGAVLARGFRRCGELFAKSLSWLASLNWPLVAWNILTVPVVALIYWVINAHGLRMQIPIFAMRLYKIPLPGFSSFRDYEGLYSLDLAHVMAMLLLGFVWYFWIVVVQVIFYGHDSLVSPSDRRSTYYVFLLSLAGVIVTCDAIVFYCGLFEFSGGWGESSPFVPFIATLLYTALLAALAMVHVRLSARHDQKH